MRTCAAIVDQKLDNESFCILLSIDSDKPADDIFKYLVDNYEHAVRIYLHDNGVWWTTIKTDKVWWPPFEVIFQMIEV